MRPTLIALGAALLMGGAPAFAQSKAEMDELRNEIRKLREEINALKQGAAAKPAPAPAAAPAVVERVEQVEIKQNDAVVGGDIGGSFRLPGSETSIRLYGYAEGHAIHDIGKPGQSDLFTDLTFQPLDNDPTVQKGATRFTASTSRFGFETSTPTALGSFTTKLEGDFYSYGADNRNRLRLRHAYGEYAGWLVGQTWSNFMDLDNTPETVDFNGPIGTPFSRRMMVRYSYADPKAGYKLTAAFEDPQDQFGGGSTGERMPQIVLRYDQSFEGGAFNARLLGHEKRSAPVDSAGNVRPSDTKYGFGWALGANYKIGSGLLMAQYTMVDGDVDQLYGSNGYSIDDASGQLTFDRNQGIVLGYTHTFSDQWRSTIGYGTNKGERAAAVNNSRLQQGHINFFYTPIKNVDLGAEYIYGTRKTFDGDKGVLNRIDLMGRYSF